MVQLGQHPAPSRIVAHISDTHLLGGGKKQYGVLENESNLRQALAQLAALENKPQAVVFTGDLADLGEADAYRALRAIVEPAVAELGAELIWVMGNHDERPAYAQELFDEDPSLEPHNRVYDIDGLRIISFDTTVPGYHHGDVTEEQAAWLAAELATPAPHGTLIAVHHPPIPTPLLQAMDLLELQNQSRLADVVRGSDVRAILAGHLHFPTHATFAGIPVSVAAATCYTLALTVQDSLLSSVDANQAINLVHVYDDTIVHTIVPLGVEPEIAGFSRDNLATIEAMTPEQRIEVFSKKDSDFNRKAG